MCFISDLLTVLCVCDLSFIPFVLKAGREFGFLKAAKDYTMYSCRAITTNLDVLNAHIKVQRLLNVNSRLLAIQQFVLNIN